MNWAGRGGGVENSAVVRETFLTESDIAHSHDGLFMDMDLFRLLCMYKTKTFLPSAT